MIFLKLARTIVKTMFFTFLACSVVIFSGVIYLDYTIDNEYNLENGKSLNINSVIPITAELSGEEFSKLNENYTVGAEYNVNLKAFGFIPISQTKVKVIDKLKVAVLGTPFGMRIYTKGVLISDITDVLTVNGNKNPAKDAGLKIGDYIVSVDGKKIYTNEDLGYIVETSNGKNMKFEVIRNNTKIYFNFAAVPDKITKQYKIGVWVKDSSAGIGTLTFYNPSNNIICGLGHGVCDDDSKKLLKIEKGEIVSAKIISISKGSIGEAGKLEGRFKYQNLGDIVLNCEKGIYSNFTGDIKFTNLTEIALKQEIKNGDAEILCTVDGEEPKYYSCKVEIKKGGYNSSTQNMIVTVTDDELIDKTGGIVQGMSGSPILQNGKLIGAVTHVLLEDSKKGYAIFAENMLETAKNVEQLKDAG